MDGVGKTRVMLTFSDEGTDQLDKNVTKDGNKKKKRQRWCTIPVIPDSPM